MPRFLLTATDDDNVVTTKEFDSSYLSDAVEHVSDFLHGVGFCFDSLSISNESHIDDSSLEDPRTDSGVVFLSEKVTKNTNTVYKDETWQYIISHLIYTDVVQLNYTVNSWAKLLDEVVPREDIILQVNH